MLERVPCHGRRDSMGAQAHVLPQWTSQVLTRPCIMTKLLAECRASAFLEDPDAAQGSCALYVALPVTLQPAIPPSPPPSACPTLINPVHQLAAQPSALSSTPNPAHPLLMPPAAPHQAVNKGMQTDPPPPLLMPTTVPTQAVNKGMQTGPAAVVRRAAGVHHLHHLPGRAGCPRS